MDKATTVLRGKITNGFVLYVNNSILYLLENQWRADKIGITDHTYMFQRVV